MRETYGGQQSDEWLRIRVGRITASRINDVCGRLTRKSGNKVAGDPNAKRDDYLEELITARLCGFHKDHYTTPSMQRGIELEPDAWLVYANYIEEPVTPVGFVLHPEYDFTGASADSLVGDKGVLEIKCLLPWNHIHYVLRGEVPEEYIPQIGWEIACAKREWCDFVLYCPDIQGEGNERLRFWYRRIYIKDLRWELWDGTALQGQAVIDYFTSEVLALESEIRNFMEQGGYKPIAPFEVRLKAPEEPSSGAEFDASSDEFAYLDRTELTP